VIISAKLLLKVGLLMIWLNGATLIFYVTKKKILDRMKKSIQDVRDNPVSDYAKLKADYMFTNLEVSISLHLGLNYWHISGLLVVWMLNCWFAVV
jgi:hypothetical protein